MILLHDPRLEMEPNLSSSGSRNGLRFRLREIIQAPLLAFVEQFGVFHMPSEPASSSDHEMQRDDAVTDEVAIRITGGVEEELPVNVVGDADGEERMDGFSEGGVEESRSGDGVDEQPPSSNNSRYDIQNVAQWIEQILPFSLLLLVVLIRQHLQGFFGTIWISAVLFKSNDILQKQTALKGERKFLVLISITVIFVLHVVFVYWWYQNDDLMYPLVLLPPKSVPPFSHALFIILVNDSMARQAAMVFKCLLLMYYKNSGGHNYRKQLRLLFAALRALSGKELHYGSSASTDQVNAAGDICAICQEKLHSPIVLRCKHIFCEECVLEWFDRERTCPLCRALVKPADIKSYSDGSTSLFCQFF